MTPSVELTPEELVPYLRTRGSPIAGELRRRAEALIAEAPIDARGVWRAEDGKIYLCGTIGARFDIWQRRLAVLGATDAFLAQAIGAAAVEKVMDALEAEAKASTPGEWGPRRSPGYGPLPLADSAMILDKLDAAKRIGVSLTSDFLLVPSKSVTAVLSGLIDVRAAGVV